MIPPFHRFLTHLLFAFFLASLVQADCSFTSSGLVPLSDLGSGNYQGFPGGLYPNGQSVRPAAHELAATSIATSQIQPRDASGNVDLVNGRIVMISIGMSNATQEFSVFTSRTNSDLATNPRLLVVDGAQSSITAQVWADNAAPWSVLASRLTAAGVSASQVQVAWIKNANPRPGQSGLGFPGHAQDLQADFESIARQLTTRFPNIRLAYLSGRTRSYSNVVSDLNPEPYAYESSLSMRWMIEKQLSGDLTLNYDPSRGPRVAPLLMWSSYLWIDGTNPRSDGLTWLCSDLMSDFTHPSSTGVTKVANQLQNFFKTDTTTTPWFLKSTVVGTAPTANASASSVSGIAPLTVDFTMTASDSDGTITEYRWNFGDSTSSILQNTRKIFSIPGTYNVRAAVFDNQGNRDIKTITVTVAASGDSIAPSPPTGLTVN